MSMSRRTADALIGLLVLSVLSVLVIALAVTGGWNQRRIVIYMLSPSVQDLKQDTPVSLQGLGIGEVASISPQVDTGRMGAPQFVVALRIRERFSNGALLRLPVGTRGEITSTGLIGAASISLVVPADNQATLTPLAPGDTIRGELTEGWTDVVKSVADTLRTQISDILRDTRQVLLTLNRTAGTAHDELATTGPELRRTLDEVQRTLAVVRPVLLRADTVLAGADRRVGALQDSLTPVLAEARTLMEHLDSLTLLASGIAGENRASLRRTADHLYVVSAKLEYFLDQVSRRPLRMITGVRPLPRDSIPGASE
jgi:ABC-type transporter Mla subunit MlaD